MSAALDAIAGGWQISGMNIFTPGEHGDVAVHAGAAFQVRRSPTTSRAPTTTGRISPAIPRCRRISDRSPTGSMRRAWRCRPMPASRSATRHATTCAGQSSGRWISRRSKQIRVAGEPSRVPRRGVQPVQPRELHAAGTNRSLARSAPSPSTYPHGRFSWGSSCSGRSLSASVPGVSFQFTGHRGVGSRATLNWQLTTGN